jgi:hypothetical protein
LGIYIQRDSEPSHITFEQYSYASFNLLSFTDPLGKDAELDAFNSVLKDYKENAEVRIQQVVKDTNTDINNLQLSK